MTSSSWCRGAPTRPRSIQITSVGQRDRGPRRVRGRPRRLAPRSGRAQAAQESPPPPPGRRWRSRSSSTSSRAGGPAARASASRCRWPARQAWVPRSLPMRVSSPAGSASTKALGLGQPGARPQTRSSPMSAPKRDVCRATVSSKRNVDWLTSAALLGQPAAGRAPRRVPSASQQAPRRCSGSTSRTSSETSVDLAAAGGGRRSRPSRPARHVEGDVTVSTGGGPPDLLRVRPGQVALGVDRGRRTRRSRRRRRRAWPGRWPAGPDRPPYVLAAGGGEHAPATRSQPTTTRGRSPSTPADRPDRGGQDAEQVRDADQLADRGRRPRSAAGSPPTNSTASVPSVGSPSMNRVEQARASRADPDHRVPAAPPEALPKRAVSLVLRGRAS